MGIGDYPAGFEPAGDPVPSVTPSLARTAPLALQFDPTTRQHVYDATTGRYAELHPIDAKVVNSLFLALRKMPGARSVGADWRRITSPHAKDAEATAKDIVNTALAQPIRDREIELRRVTFEARGIFGTSITVVEYVNLHLDAKVRSVRVG